MLTKAPAISLSWGPFPHAQTPHAPSDICRHAVDCCNAPASDSLSPALNTGWQYVNGRRLFIDSIPKISFSFPPPKRSEGTGLRRPLLSYCADVATGPESNESRGGIGFVGWTGGLV